MMRFTVISILWVILACGVFSQFDEHEEESDVSRLLQNERRKLLQDPVSGVVIWAAIMGTISAVAGSTIAGVNIANAVNIDDDGAQFTINNYFRDVELHFKGYYVVEGSNIKGASQPTIRAASTDNSGGAFDDSGSDTSSAGYVQYEVTNPISGEKYCYAYAWGMDYDEWGSDANIIMAGIYQSPCPMFPVSLPSWTGFNGASMGWFNFDANVGKNSVYRDGYGWTTYRTKSVQEALKGISLSSMDTKIGMSLQVSLPDGDSDHPQITIDVGPYTKIFGHGTTNRYNIYYQHGHCTSGYDMVGTYDSATDCHDACVASKGKDGCKYFLYDVASARCLWLWDISKCGQDSTKTNYLIYNTINYYDEYTLLENDQNCPTKGKQITGEHSTTDECWDACKKENNGIKCEVVAYGYSKEKDGECWKHLKNDCGNGRMVKAVGYNLYGEVAKN